jgi:hypothetical protein
MFPKFKQVHADMNNNIYVYNPEKDFCPVIKHYFFKSESQVPMRYHTNFND